MFPFNGRFDANTLKVAAVILFYMAAALVMVFVNKAVLSSTPDIPFLFLFNQVIIAVILLHAAAAVSSRVQIPRLDIHVAKNLFPLIFVGIFGLIFNTLCLRGVDASFFQIARGLVLPLTIFLSSVVSKSTPSTKVVFAAAIVTIGFFLGVAPSASVPLTATPSLLSLIYGVLSSLFIALHAVLIKRSLPHCNNSTIELAWWVNACSALVFLPLAILSGEHSKFLVMYQRADRSGHTFLWGSLITGVFGFLLCIAGLLSVKVTSPVTHMFSSAARSVLQTILGVWIFSDILTVNRATSILVILGGTMFYTWIKSAETPPAPRQPVDVESGKVDREGKGEDMVDLQQQSYRNGVTGQKE